MKPFKEVIDGIRKAIMASEVREDIAQMGEYVEQFASTATTKAAEAAASAKTAADAAGNASTAVSAAIDPTLSVSGKAADAAKVGEAVNAEAERAKGVESQIKEDLIDQNLISINRLNPKHYVQDKIPNYVVGESKPTDLVGEAGIGTCTSLIPVSVGDELFVGDNTGNYSYMIYVYDSDKRYVKRYVQESKITVDVDGYVMVVCMGCLSLETFKNRNYYLNKNIDFGYTEYGLNEIGLDAASNKESLNVIQDWVDTGVEVQNGYYDNGVFYQSNEYLSMKIPCKPNEKYKITEFIYGESKFSLAFFYDKNFKFIGKTEAHTSDHWYVNEIITIPDGVYYFVTSHRINNGYLKFSVKKYGFEKYTTRIDELSKKPLEGKSCLIFGDSITYQSERWRDTFLELTGLKQIACISYAGAHLTDYPNTVLDGKYWGENELIYQNTVCNQVQFVINNRNDMEIPDIIIISAFTNDSFTPSQLTSDTDVNVYDDNSSWVDVNTVDRKTPEGAMRWQTTKLHELFPNARIFYASPIQSHPMIHKISETIAKEDKMQRVCRKLSVQLIKAGSESGITGEFEFNLANGKYLSDGLHPNTEGGKVLGRYYANEVISMYRY